MCSLVAGLDHMVWPIESAALAGHEVVTLEGVGHQSLLFDEAAWVQVARVLGEPRPVVRVGPGRRAVNY